MEDFIHFSTRLSTLIVEEALKLLPYARKSISTATGSPYEGCELDVPVGRPTFDSKTMLSDRSVQLCGVSILRSGQCFEKGMRCVLQDVILGSLLIQQDDETGEPLLFHAALPPILKKRESASKHFVLLVDSQIGTAAACIMAIRILLDHGVQEDQCVMSHSIGQLGLMLV